MTDFNSTAMLGDLNHYLNGTANSNSKEEEQQLLVASLMNDLNNIRQT